MIPDADRKALLKLAREAIERYPKQMPGFDGLPESLHEKCGVFVTLTIEDKLRGCIGYINATSPLCGAVAENACHAAYSDPRFSPLRPQERKKVRIEVSVLTRPEPLAYSGPADLLEKLDSEMGVILRKGRREATFLPQVWEQLPDKIEFLEHLSMKAGLQPDAWQDDGIEVLTYRVEHFSEQEPRTPETAG